MDVVVKFYFVNILITLILLELITFFQKNIRKKMHLILFAIFSWVTVVGSLSSVVLILPYLSLAERSNILPIGVMAWIIIMLIYLFSRFFKKQSTIID